MWEPLCRCTTHAGWTTNELSVLMLVSCCATSTATGTGTGTGRQDSAPEPGDARPCARGWRRPALTTDTGPSVQNGLSELAFHFHRHVRVSYARTRPAIVIRTTTGSWTAKLVWTTVALIAITATCTPCTSLLALLWGHIVAASTHAVKSARSIADVAYTMWATRIVITWCYTMRAVLVAAPASRALTTMHASVCCASSAVLARSVVTAVICWVVARGARPAWETLASAAATLRRALAVGAAWRGITWAGWWWRPSARVTYQNHHTQCDHSYYGTVAIATPSLRGEWHVTETPELEL